jgi:hypothetical protein
VVGLVVINQLKVEQVEVVQVVIVHQDMDQVHFKDHHKN